MKPKTRFINRHARAITVLGHLKRLAKDASLGEIHVQPYKNGREHGFTVERWSPDLKAAFSENRNSDDIVVYRGSGREFDMAGNIPDEEVYRVRASYHASAEAAALTLFAFLSGPHGPA